MLVRCVPPSGHPPVGMIPLADLDWLIARRWLEIDPAHSDGVFEDLHLGDARPACADIFTINDTQNIALGDGRPDVGKPTLVVGTLGSHAAIVVARPRSLALKPWPHAALAADCRPVR